MSAIAKQGLAWDVLEPSDGRPNSVRISDFVIFALIVLEGLSVPGTIEFPVNELVALIGLLLAMTRHPLPGAKVPAWVPMLLVLFLGWMLITSQLHGDLNVRRLGHMAIWCLMIFYLATGRFDLRSAGYGMAAGLSVGAAYGFVTLPQSSYVGRLTGVWGDPNLAGLIVVVCGSLALSQIKRRSVQWVLALVFMATAVATLSRTSILAMAVVIAWLLVGRRLGLLFGYAMLGGAAWYIATLPQNVRVLGPFEGRSGSDALREQISEAAHAIVAQSPLTGHGAGATRVTLDNGLSFFFHDSYLALQSEGGQIAVFFMLALYVLAFNTIGRLPLTLRNGWFEAALVGVLICALTIGEALLSWPAALALGFALRQCVDLFDIAYGPAESP